MNALLRVIVSLSSLLLVGGGVLLALPAQGPRPACTVTGRVVNLGTALPGVSVTATRDGQVVAATSTDMNGAYRLRIPEGEFVVSAELAAFARFEQTLTVSADSCEGPLDVQLVLTSRAQIASGQQSGPVIEAPSSLRRPNRLGTGAGQQSTGQPRFSQLQLVQSNAAAAADSSSTSIDDADPATRLLPPGFSTEAATSVVAVTGEAVNVDRGQLRDRFEALGRGEFAAAGAQPPEGFGPRFGGPGGAPGAFAGAQGGFGGPGGFGPGLQGGPGGPGGGRGGAFFGRGRGGNTLQGSANYNFGGSVLDASPYPIRANSQDDPTYARNQFGATLGGPLRIPGVYDGARTTFFVNYAGGRSNNLVDQYATVPTEAMRSGNFSSLAVGPLDPITGTPFFGGQIPQGQLDPSALALLNFFPLPNLPGTTQNYRRSTAALATSDQFNARLTHNFSGTPGRRGGGGGGGRGAGGFGRGGGGRGGRSGTAVVLNAQLQYRRNLADIVNVFPLLGGTNNGSTWSVPVSLNILRGRSIHNVQVNMTRSSTVIRNGFAGSIDVAGLAGINGVATNPSQWGVPSLSFASLTSLRDVAPDDRSDRRIQIGYTMTHPLRSHTFRVGGDARLDRSGGITTGDARGAYVFTGLYSAGSPGVRSSGLDFADFLLGLPQQASVQYAEDVALSGRAFSLFVQDDWRIRGNLTLNLGARYEAVSPYTEAHNRMVNLDVAPGFTAAAPVISGGTGPYSGAFPSSLINADYNNLAPRVGVAWRMNPRTVVRGGFGTSFNNGSYAAIARQLIAQPPFAVTSTSIGSLTDPLLLSDAFASIDDSTTTNNFGVDKNYQLGVIKTWNVDVNHNLGRGWQAGGGYTGTQGTHLDVVRAPNRDPDGLRIEGVQPFLWQTSEGDSILHAATIRLRKQQSRGVGGSVSYTFAKSIDDASSIGGGGRVVAQNDQNLDAEWGLSSFDRRHQVAGNLFVEFPFGPNRRWLNGGGTWAALLRDWGVSMSFAADSGTPFTARLVGATSDVARGTNGTLRADYTGAPISIDDPTLLRFFNTSAFAVPATNAFGSAGRNTIIGPGTQQVDASISRDVRLSGNQVVSIQLQATNLFNTVRFGAIDSVVNSPTFGQVVTIRPMRTVQLGVRFRF
jgi:hypothetical protein